MSTLVFPSPCAHFYSRMTVVPPNNREERGSHYVIMVPAPHINSPKQEQVDDEEGGGGAVGAAAAIDTSVSSDVSYASSGRCIDDDFDLFDPDAVDFEPLLVTGSKYTGIYFIAIV